MPSHDGVVRGRPRTACGSPPLFLTLAVVLGACTQTAVEDADPPASQADEAETLSAETREGPIVATVSLTPAAPRLGDSLVLTLAVAADTGVTVEMPVFGDALGRFGIVDYTPRREAGAGRWRRVDATLHLAVADERAPAHPAATGRIRR